MNSTRSRKCKRVITVDAKKDWVWGRNKPRSVIDVINGISFESKLMEDMMAFKAAASKAAKLVKRYIEAVAVKGRDRSLVTVFF